MPYRVELFIVRQDPLIVRNQQEQGRTTKVTDGENVSNSILFNTFTIFGSAGDEENIMV